MNYTKLQVARGLEPIPASTGHHGQVANLTQGQHGETIVRTHS